MRRVENEKNEIVGKWALSNGVAKRWNSVDGDGSGCWTLGRHGARDIFDGTAC